MFLQIHTLVSYPASLLNRDDAGLAKRIPFGNAMRLRVSSQCLKRHWREDLTEKLSDIPDGLRTRSFFTRSVLPRLTASGMATDRAEAMVKALADAVVKGGVEKNAEMTQPVLFGLREADYFAQMVEAANQDAADTAAAVKKLTEWLKSPDEKKNLAAMSKSAAGLTASLFGRMVTSDLLSRVDAPVHVAHAFTVHAAATEMDYFTVVDDLNREDETGAAHANQTELGAGVFYDYVVVDVALLIANLTGADAKDWRLRDAATTRRVLEALIPTIATKSPGAKLGATAPYSRAELVFLEVGAEQPRTLANAFLEAMPMRNDPMREAARRMGEYLKRVDAMYGNMGGTRTISTIHDASLFAPLQSQPLPDALKTALDAIWS